MKYKLNLVVTRIVLPEKHKLPTFYSQKMLQQVDKRDGELFEIIVDFRARSSKYNFQAVDWI